jgi:hypothetical protein
LTEVDQPIDHGGGLSPSIDIVAQHDQDRPILTPERPEVLCHPLDQAIQKIEPTVHVPNGVEQASIGGRRTLGLLLRPEKRFEHRARQVGDRRREDRSILPQPARQFNGVLAG